MENKNILSRIKFVTTTAGELYIVIPKELHVEFAEKKIQLPEFRQTGYDGLNDIQIIVKYENK